MKASRSTSTEGTGSGPLVLILDDEALILMDLRFALEDEGATVQEARTANAALELIAARTPDVAVLDVNLGRGRTCEPVALRLRELGVPFLLHTGDLDRQGELVRNIAAPVVPKPSMGYEVARRALQLIATER